jgi:hypothetical protein
MATAVDASGAPFAPNDNDFHRGGTRRDEPVLVKKKVAIAAVLVAAVLAAGVGLVAIGGLTLRSASADTSINLAGGWHPADMTSAEQSAWATRASQDGGKPLLVKTRDLANTEAPKEVWVKDDLHYVAVISHLVGTSGTSSARLTTSAANRYSMFTQIYSLADPTSVITTIAGTAANLKTFTYRGGQVMNITDNFAVDGTADPNGIVRSDYVNGAATGIESQDGAGPWTAGNACTGLTPMEQLAARMLKYECELASRAQTDSTLQGRNYDISCLSSGVAAGYWVQAAPTLCAG